MTGAALLLGFWLAGPPSAPAPLRSGAERTQLTSLAESLGRAHALHRLCAGPADDLWRSRMGRLMETERPEPILRQRLTDGFNAGFAGGSAAFAACTPQSRGALQDAELAAARKARILATPRSGPGM